MSKCPCCAMHWQKFKRLPRILTLPQANLHADLFRDNVLFDGNHLAGVIDFTTPARGRCFTTWRSP